MGSIVFHGYDIDASMFVFFMYVLVFPFLYMG